MKTTVVNLMNEEYDIYIGRSNPRKGLRKSILHNPYKIDRNSGISRKMSIEMYRKYFYEKIKEDPAFKAEVERCRGKRLGCWCKPLLCHGDVIVEYLENEIRT